MGSARIGRAVLVTATLVALTGCIPADLGPRASIAEPTIGSLERRTAEQRRLSDAAMTTRVAAGQPGCSAAVAVRGEVRWSGAAGLADLANGIPVTVDTRFDIASVSKQFTATAILLLEREGLVALDDPIATYVDGLPAWAQTTTLDQLMHHSSRIRDFWVELDEVGIGFADLADQAVTLAAIARETELEPGVGYFYSNSNYVLLAEVVQRVTGTALPEFLAQRIFEPLGLDMVVAPGLQGPDIALSYDDQSNPQPSGWTAYGHTGIIATMSQLARWGDQYRVGDLVREDHAIDAVDSGLNERYAAGIDIEPDGDLTHGGRWGGYLTDFTVSDDRETTIAVACNGSAADRSGVAAALWQIWDPTSYE